MSTRSITIIDDSDCGEIIMPIKKTRVATKPSRIKIGVFVDPLTAKSLRDHRLAQGRLIDLAVGLYLRLELEGLTNGEVVL